MIVDYCRPKKLEDALELLNQTNRKYIPLAGGTSIDPYLREDIGVVDLQDLGLNHIQDRGNTIDIGATTTLQRLVDAPLIQSELKRAVLHEATYNLRQIASIAGSLVTANGRSPFATACLALDAKLVIEPEGEQVALGDFLNRRSEFLDGRLITHIILPLKVIFRYDYVARTPADLPIVCVGVAQWPSRRTRVALGGFGLDPKLAMDGPEKDGADIAAMNAYSNAGDQWASADYRQEIAGVLVRRCIDELSLLI